MGVYKVAHDDAADEQHCAQDGDYDDEDSIGSTFSALRALALHARTTFQHVSVCTACAVPSLARTGPALSAALLAAALRYELAIFAL